MKPLQIQINDFTKREIRKLASQLHFKPKEIHFYLDLNWTYEDLMMKRGGWYIKKKKKLTNH